MFYPAIEVPHFHTKLAHFPSLPNPSFKFLQSLYPSHFTNLNRLISCLEPCKYCSIYQWLFQTRPESNCVKSNDRFLHQKYPVSYSMNQKKNILKTLPILPFLQFQTRNRISNYNRSWDHQCISFLQKKECCSAQHEHKRLFPWRLSLKQTLRKFSWSSLPLVPAWYPRFHSSSHHSII